MSDFPEAFKHEAPAAVDLDGGELVKLDSNDELTPTTAVGDDFVGVVQDQTDSGETATAKTAGKVDLVLADSAVSAQDDLQPSGTNDGHVDVQGGGNTPVGSAVNGASADGDGITVALRHDNFG